MKLFKKITTVTVAPAPANPDLCDGLVYDGEGMCRVASVEGVTYQATFGANEVNLDNAGMDLLYGSGTFVSAGTIFILSGTPSLPVTAVVRDISTPGTPVPVDIGDSSELFDALTIVPVTGVTVLRDTVSGISYDLYALGGDGGLPVLSLEFETTRNASEFTVASVAGSTFYGFQRIAGPPTTLYHSQELKAETALFNLLNDRASEIVVPLLQGFTADDMERSCVVVQSPGGKPSEMKRNRWDVDLSIKVFTVMAGGSYATHMARVSLVRSILYQDNLADLLTDAVSNFTVLAIPQAGRSINTIKGRCWMTETTFSAPCVGVDLE